MHSRLFDSGMVPGRYPERDEREVGRFEQATERFWQRMTHGARFGRGRLRRFVRRVERSGKTARRHSDPVLRRELRKAGYRLRREGISKSATAHVFALIREQAARTLQMSHYPVQLMGGWVMINGLLAEMDTGEGKTLATTLPAAALALAGIRVHVITANDYLAARDAEAMGPLYRALGLRTGVVLEAMSTPQRQDAYRCDITYCSNKQVAFDYLRDRMVLGEQPGRLWLELESGESTAGERESRLLMRGLSFAIVDEADSVLIDEARTPLILSREGPLGQKQEVYRQAVGIARKLWQGRDYRIDRKRRELQLTEAGRQRAETMARAIGGLWTGRRHREILLQQALTALHLFRRDRHYLVQDGKVQIVDEYTGRTMKDRSWERGLHQMIETKEGCILSGERETLTRISYQRFFRRYLGLAGTTGTAREASREFHAVYQLQVVSIPSHRRCRRKNQGQMIFRTRADKWRAVVDRVRKMQLQGRPVLVGTCSVGDSEHLSGLLSRAGLPHQVLNARQDSDEAEVVRLAGQAGCITVATNMAGRGTDIPLGSGVAKAGGLHVIATQRNEARRIDRQLFGRCGRQGDRGSYESLLSYEDEPMENFYSPQVARRVGQILGWPVPPLPLLGHILMRLPQWAMEQRHRNIRKVFRQADDNMGKLLAFSGNSE